MQTLGIVLIMSGVIIVSAVVTVIFLDWEYGRQTTRRESFLDDL